MLQVKLGRDIDKKLGDLSKWTGRTKEELVRQTVQDYLEEVALYYRGIAALREYEKSGEQGCTLEEVSKELGLESDIDKEG